VEIAGFLAANVVAVLAPALGRLLSRTVDRLTDRASDRISDVALKRAEALWTTVRPKVESTPGAMRAAQRVAEQPDNEDFQAALRVELDELLAADPRFQQAVERKLTEIGITHVEQQGDRSVMVGRDNSGTIIHTDSYHAYGGGRSELDDFRESHPAAKLLIALGLAVALVGFAIFLIPIFQAFTDNSQPGDPGFAQGPDATPAAIGFGIMVMGIAIAGAGQMIAGFTKRRS
jgi:hypothetical protein